MNDRKATKAKSAPQSSKRSSRIVAGGIVILTLAGIALYMTRSSRTNQTHIGDLMERTAMASPIPGQDFRIPISDASDKAKFYDYKLSSGKSIKLFVIKSSDGVVRAALDACIICYRFHLGYHQEGEDMVCNKCKRHFRSLDVNVKSGACNPIPLTRTVEGNTLVIKAADLEQGAVYF